MKEWHLLSEEEKKEKIGQVQVFLEEGVRAMMLEIESRIKLCNTTRERMILIREHTKIFEIFSAEEIIEFNQLERGIPKIIRDLQDFRQVLRAESCRFFIEGTASKKLAEITAREEKIRAFLAEKTPKVSKPVAFLFRITDCIQKK